MKTIYEVLADAKINSLLNKISNGSDFKLTEFRRAFAERGHAEKEFEEFCVALTECARLAVEVSVGTLTLREARQKAMKGDVTVPFFRFTKEERELILEIESRGRICPGQIMTYKGYSQSVVGASYNEMPAKIDAYVIFSGHPLTAYYAVLGWLADLVWTGKPKKLIFLGLEDNQGHTDFSNHNLKYKVSSEAEMYRRFFMACGISREIVEECMVEVTDTSTDENQEVLAYALKKYIINEENPQEELNLALYCYLAYAKRVGAEFTFGFAKRNDLPKINFFMADWEAEPDGARFASYDNIDAAAPDIIVGNCMAHVFREIGKKRCDSGLGEYPEGWKSLLPLCLGYSYPNVAQELTGTELPVGTTLKLLRDKMFKQYGWEDSDIVDEQIDFAVEKARQVILNLNYMSAELINKGAEMTKKEWLKAFLGH